MPLTRIKTDNILDGEVRTRDLSNSAVTLDKLDFVGAGALGDVLTVDNSGNLLFVAIGLGPIPISLTTLIDVDPAGANADDVLVFNGTTLKFEPQPIPGLGASSNTFIVQNIVGRDALSPAAGDQSFVRDGGTTGEWELYLFDSVWILIATQDSAATDARTIAGDIDPSTISPVLLGNVSAGSRVTLVTIEVIIAFDGAPVLTVGTDADNDELASNAEIDLSATGTYTITTDVEYLATPDTDIKAFFTAGGATVGDARILVTYV